MACDPSIMTNARKQRKIFKFYIPGKHIVNVIINDYHLKLVFRKHFLQKL